MLNRCHFESLGGFQGRNRRFQGFLEVLDVIKSLGGFQGRYRGFQGIMEVVDDIFC